MRSSRVADLVNNANLIAKGTSPVSLRRPPRLCPPQSTWRCPCSRSLVALYYGAVPRLSLLALPLWLLGLAVTAFGVTLWLSALNVKYRDVQHAVPPVLQVWLFASPVAYPSTLLDGWAELVYSLNPMVGVIGLARWSLLGTPWPGWSLLVSAGSAVVVALSGLIYFNRSQRTFADVI